MQITNYYNDGEPHLREKTKVYDFSLDIDFEELKTFCKTQNAFGMAANQMGYDQSFFLLYNHLNVDYDVIINPKIIDKSKGLLFSREGCLSFPNLWLLIKRHEWIDVEYQDENESTISTRLEHERSIGYQHELDHLNGILFIDHVSKLKLKMAEKKRSKNNYV